ncbi:hypothetical protein [Aeoliella sp.]|uniref:hypothetical protein n=1 Tax=Aeoliella sp. TaxID=2795800 RepID=UPI003CCBF5AE
MEDRTRFTTEQVLRGIQAYVELDVDKELVIDPDASVNDYRQAIEDSHECPLCFLEMLAEYFGFQYSETRWAVWLKIKSPPGLSKSERKRAWEHWQEVTSKTITVRKLAEHIADHAPGTSMKPATVFGVECAPAGVFRGLCQLPEVRGKRVAPSTRISQVMGCSKIEEMWGRAKWISGSNLPMLKRNPWWSLRSPADWIDAVGQCLAIVVALATLIYIGLETDSAFYAFAAAVPTLGILLILTYCASDTQRNPLPEGVTTFGDLARLIAKSEAVS